MGDLNQGHLNFSPLLASNSITSPLVAPLFHRDNGAVPVCLVDINLKKSNKLFLNRETLYKDKF